MISAPFFWEHPFHTGLCCHLCQSTRELSAINNMNIFYDVLEDDKYHAEKSPREKVWRFSILSRYFFGKTSMRQSYVCRKIWGSEELSRVTGGAGGEGRREAFQRAGQWLWSQERAWHVCDMHVAFCSVLQLAWTLASPKELGWFSLWGNTNVHVVEKSLLFVPLALRHLGGHVTGP